MKSLRPQVTGKLSLDPSEAIAIRAHLDSLMSYPAFAASQRKAQLLRYLVERTLAGEGPQITEYGIGLDVFEKPESFDPRIDSTIRSEVSRLRQKLREYYSNGGRGDGLVIDFPPRSYVPTFTFRPRARTMPWRKIVVAAAVAVVVTGGFVWWRANRAEGGAIGSLVVLPFGNLSPDRQDEYLADGLTEELTNQLAQWQDLRVVARTSAFQFKGKALDVREIGRRLNVDAVLEGSFEKQGDRLRITAQLNRASNGYHLWSHAFEARSEDMMAVQAEMARSIAAAIRGLGRASPAAAPDVSTSSPEAHDLYLRANYQFALHTPESYGKSLELFNAAAAKDPSYVSAYTGTARAEIAMIHITAEAPIDGFKRARAALKTAIEINPHSAEAHGQMADLDYAYDWDWPRAEREFRLALEEGAQSLTHSFYGWGLATRGRFAEAHRQFRIAQDLDPLGEGPLVNQVMAYYLERRYPEAKKTLQQILDSRMGALDAHLLLGLVAAVQKDCEQAGYQFEWCDRSYPSPLTKFGLALNAACRGKRDQARSYLSDAASTGGRAFASPYQLALGYAYLGDKEPALDFLQKSADAKEGQILYLKYEPIFDQIRSDPRFIALETKVGLSQ